MSIVRNRYVILSIKLLKVFFRQRKHHLKLVYLNWGNFNFQFLVDFHDIRTQKTKEGKTEDRNVLFYFYPLLFLVIRLCNIFFWLQILSIIWPTENSKEGQDPNLVLVETNFKLMNNYTYNLYRRRFKDLSWLMVSTRRFPDLVSALLFFSGILYNGLSSLGRTLRLRNTPWTHIFRHKTYQPKNLIQGFIINYHSRLRKCSNLHVPVEK